MRRRALTRPAAAIIMPIMKIALLLSDQSRRAKQPRIGDFRRTLVGKDYLYIWEGKLYGANEIAKFNKAADYVCRQWENYGNLIIPILVADEDVQGNDTQNRAQLSREDFVSLISATGFTREQHLAKIEEMTRMAEGAIAAGKWIEARLTQLHVEWYQQWCDDNEISDVLQQTAKLPPTPPVPPTKAKTPETAKKRPGRPAKAKPPVKPRASGTL